jgi:hypothetical protein
MYQDETGFYDVYGPLVSPWWKTTLFQGGVCLLSLVLLGVLGFFFYKRLNKKRAITDLEQLILHRALLDKTENSTIIVYDYVIRVLKTFFPELPQKSSLTAQELVILVKNWHYKDLLDNSVDQLVSIITRADHVRFGKEDLVWDVIYDDIDFIIAVAKKIQSMSKK